MGKHHNSVVVVRIQPKFEWMCSTITKSLSKKLNGGGRERVSQVADLGFKICQKLPKNALLGAIWVCRISLEGAICIGTNLDDEQTPLIAV